MSEFENIKKLAEGFESLLDPRVAELERENAALQQSRGEAAEHVLDLLKKLSHATAQVEQLAVERGELAFKIADLQQWKEAVIDVAVICGIYRAAHDLDGRKCVDEIVQWEITTAFDPLVSRHMAALYAFLDWQHSEIKKLRAVLDHHMRGTLAQSLERPPHDRP